MREKGTNHQRETKRGKKRAMGSASYQTVREEGCRRCLWVTAQRWRARRLCCQSKAPGRWVWGRTVEKKGDRKCISRRTPLSPGERLTTEALLSLTHTEDEKTFPLPAEGTETNWTPPTPTPRHCFMTMLPVSSAGWIWSGVSAVLRSSRRRLPGTPRSETNICCLSATRFPPVNTGRICCRSSPSIFTCLPPRRTWKTPPPVTGVHRISAAPSSSLCVLDA